jgi:O-antigen ligase
MEQPKAITKSISHKLPKIREYQWGQVQWLGFILLNVLLALAMNAFQVVSTIHAILTLAIGLFVVATARHPRQVAWVTAYICGAEILWRMTKAGVFWEYGKYAIVLLMILALFRMRKISNAGLPILYFTLLIVSIPLTLIDLPLESSRQAISFNLSGPLCLAVSAIFFSQTKLNSKDRSILSWYLVAPIIGIAALSVRGIVTAKELTFGSESMFATSGGYGPNQVAAILGLGAVLMILLAIQERSAQSRWIPVIIALALLTLSALTFSRGGLYNVAASILMVAVFSIRSRRLRRTFLPLFILALVIGTVFIYPRLNEFTEGMLQIRFSDTDPTGRISIALSEISVWQKNPIFGVGPGMGAFHLVEELGTKVAAHTEYTRMLAEHGIMGVFSGIILLIMSIKAVLKSSSGQAQGISAALIAWPLMEMAHAAMRISAIGFTFGLAFIIWSPNRDDETKISKTAD